MKKIGMFAVVLGFTLTSMMLSSASNIEVVIGLERIVELREQQLKHSLEQGDAVTTEKVSIQLSQSKIDLAKEKGEKAKVRAELDKLVGSYEKLAELGGELSNEERLSNRIELEQARIARARYLAANPTEDVFIGSGVSISVDF